MRGIVFITGCLTLLKEKDFEKYFSKPGNRNLTVYTFRNYKELEKVAKKFEKVVPPSDKKFYAKFKKS